MSKTKSKSNRVANDPATKKSALSSSMFAVSLILVIAAITVAPQLQNFVFLRGNTTLNILPIQAQRINQKDFNVLRKPVPRNATEVADIPSPDNA